MQKFADLKPAIRLAIVNPNSNGHSEFGRGIASLCQGVRELGSLNAAAKSMGMAYSKAWRIIKETEEELGVELLSRDGAHGSSLTSEGEMLLDGYLKAEAYLSREAEEFFYRIHKAD